MEQKALLIIDMQKGSFIQTTPRYNAEVVCENINALSAKFREQKFAVIFIQHDGSRQNSFIPGSGEWQILPELATKPDDIFVGKTANDSFYRSELDNILKIRKIKQIVITGCATDFCVDTTVRSALSKDYQISVIADGHTTGNRPTLNAKEVIDHHNWVWSEMTSTNGSIELISCSDYLKRMDEVPSKMIWY